MRAVIEAIFLRNLVGWLEFDEPQDAPIIESDATAALGAAARFGVGKRMKHIEPQTLFIQKEVNEGKVKLKKLPSQDNLSDAGTKPLNEPVFRRLLSKVGIQFLTAAIIAAKVKVAEGAETPGLRTTSVVTTMYEVSTETITRVQSTMQNGVGVVDIFLLVMIMLIYEVVKELLKAVLVDKLRNADWKKMCGCGRRHQVEEVPQVELAPAAQGAPGSSNDAGQDNEPLIMWMPKPHDFGKRRIRYALEIDTMVHKHPECVKLQCSKKKPRRMKVCTTCEDIDSEEEDLH